MPRKQRFFVPDVPVHVVQRGNNRQAVFFDQGDYRAWLDWLDSGALRYGCQIHAYVLMTNHVHLLLSPAGQHSIPRMMQYLGRHYVQAVNCLYQRTGTLWEGRYKASLIDADDYLLTCYRYIELNPVRAGMVNEPGEYPWSSYRVNALGHSNRYIQSHPLYLELGGSAEARCEAYRELFKASLASKDILRINRAWETGTPLGNDRFREQIEQTLGRTVGTTRRGRPGKKLDLGKGHGKRALTP